MPIHMLHSFRSQLTDWRRFALQHRLNALEDKIPGLRFASPTRVPDAAILRDVPRLKVGNELFSVQVTDLHAQTISVELDGEKFATLSVVEFKKQNTYLLTLISEDILRMSAAQEAALNALQRKGAFSGTVLNPYEGGRYYCGFAGGPEFRFFNGVPELSPPLTEYLMARSQ